MVARTPDVELKRRLLDDVVVYLAHHGLSDLSLRPMAAAIGTSASSLVHHLGPKEQILTAALQRATEIQEEVGAGWLAEQPDLSVGEWYRRWWAWLTSSPDHLALARLGYEAVTIEATRTGLPADVRADQIGIWTRRVERVMVANGVAKDVARREAVLAKAMFSGLVLDLFASGTGAGWVRCWRSTWSVWRSASMTRAGRGDVGRRRRRALDPTEQAGIGTVPIVEQSFKESDPTSAPAGGRRRREGSRDRAADRGPRLPPQRPFAQPRLRYAPTEVVSADELEAIHQASLTVLEEIGIDVLDPEARSVYEAAGASVDHETQRVRIDRTIIEAAMAHAPSSFTLHATNPAHSLQIGGNWIAYGSVASAPNVFDRDRGRRVGNIEDYRNLIRLGQMLTSVHFFGGYPVEPIDVHASVRHLDATYDALTLADKPIHVYSLGAQRNRDCIEMIRIARGIDDATLEREPSIFTIINTSSPLRLDAPMAQGVIEMARRNQVVCITPFTLAGAMAPVTIAGAVAQQNAEALAGLTLAQLVRPGAPVVYGGFTSNVDMQSGAPAFGTPEFMRAAMMGGQLARRYGVPYRSSNVCAANVLDAQAAYESVFSLWGAVMGGVNMLMHGAGWMEGGLHAGFEKMILDADLLGMVAAFLEPPAVDDESLALDAMRDVGPGGHFFGTQHTQDRYRTAFHKPMLSDWRNFESWEEAGSPTAYDKANRLYKDLLAAYEPPPVPADRVEELAAFVARRTAEGGVPTDF